LLSPFDSLVWSRPRTERLFGFRHRIELYTPAAKRLHGYYVLPFLLGDSLVARIDVKSDRGAGVLRVLGAFIEPGADPGTVALELADELRLLAGWLELEHVSVASNGDLAGTLAKAVRIGRRRVGGCPSATSPWAARACSSTCAARPPTLRCSTCTAGPACPATSS
jgi:uncharacterized protein YcaQ